MDDFIGFLVVAFFTVLAILLLWKITDMVRTSINKKKGNYDEELFDRMAQAFIQHKKDTERRLQNIEAVIAADEPADRNLGETGYETLEIDETKSNRETVSKNKTSHKKRVKDGGK